MDAKVIQAVEHIKRDVRTGYVSVGTEDAMTVVSELERVLSSQSVVQIKAGPTADDIADAVVAKLRAARKSAPDTLPPVPWQVDNDVECLRDANSKIIVFAEEFGNGVDDASMAAFRAIAEAINSYYLPHQPLPPTPAEAACANSETGIPDTAGYPVE